MKHRLLLGSCLLACSSLAHAATIDVTPSNMQGWGPWDMRNGGTVAITGVHPHNGEASLQMTTSGSSDKASYALVWNSTGANPFGTSTMLGNLSALSYDWFRDSSSTNSGVQQPALKLLWFNDTDSSGSLTVGDTRGMLIYEWAYNGSGNAPTEVWQTVNVMDASVDVWQWTTGKGDSLDYNTSVAEWRSGFDPGSNGTLLGNNTLIYGIAVEGGSGWAGLSNGAVDNITVGFTGGSTNTYNFVPEPSAMLLSLVGVVGLVRRRRA